MEKEARSRGGFAKGRFFEEAHRCVHEEKEIGNGNPSAAITA
ncbi:MAG: hypothetical protein RIQ41_403 [Candidatus Parcubacteria bacterium]